MSRNAIKRTLLTIAINAGIIAATAAHASAGAINHTEPALQSQAQR